MSDSQIDADMSVRAVMDARPATIAVFLRRRMHCPGCFMSGFVTVAEAARSYAIDADELIAELRGETSAISADAAPGRYRTPA